MADAPYKLTKIQQPAGTGPSNEMMSIRIYRVEEEACVKTQCIQLSSVADVPVDSDDNRDPDWRRTRRGSLPTKTHRTTAFTVGLSVRLPALPGR